MSARRWRGLGWALVALGVALQVGLVTGLIAPGLTPVFGWPPAVLGMFGGLLVSWVGFAVLYRRGLPAALDAMDRPPEVR